MYDELPHPASKYLIALLVCLIVYGLASAIDDFIRWIF